MSTPEELSLDGPRPRAPNPRGGPGSQIRWFLLLWLLGVLAAGCAAAVVKLLMRGAVAL